MFALIYQFIYCTSSTISFTTNNQFLDKNIGFLQNKDSVKNISPENDFYFSTDSLKDDEDYYKSKGTKKIDKRSNYNTNIGNENIHTMYSVENYNPEVEFLINTNTFTNVHTATKFNELLKKNLPGVFTLPISDIQESNAYNKNIIESLKTLLILKLEIDDLNIVIRDLDAEINLIIRTFPNIERDNSEHLKRSLQNLKIALKNKQGILNTKQLSYFELENKVRFGILNRN